MDLTSIIIESRNRFTPMKLAPNMWLDASDPTTLYDATVGGNLVTNGGTVARWEDKSGNARHATQGTSTRRPRLSTNQINNKNAILFTNTGYPTTDTFMNAGIVPSTMASNHTVFAVFKCMGPNLNFSNEITQAIFARQGFLKGLYISGLQNQFPNSVDGWAYQSGVGGVVASISTIDPSKATVAGYSMLLTPTIQINLRANNDTKIATSALTTPLNSGNVHIGRSTAGSISNDYHWPFNGYICELLYFTRVLTDIERTNLTYYLYDKWGIPLPDPDAAAYFARIEAAGSTINPNNRNAVNAFIVGCKADGIWSKITQACCFAGPDTIAGAFVPLKGNTPTYTASDHTRTGGIIGPFDTQINHTVFSKDNIHFSAWRTTASNNNHFILASGGQTGGIGTTSIEVYVGGGIATLYTRNQCTAATNVGSNLTGFIGTSRNSSASYTRRYTNTNTNDVRTSIEPLQNANIYSQTESRLSFYSIGESIDLALLNARLTALMSSLT